MTIEELIQQAFDTYKVAWAEANEINEARRNSVELLNSNKNTKHSIRYGILCQENQRNIYEASWTHAQALLSLYQRIEGIYNCPETQVRWEGQDLIVNEVRYEWDTPASCEGEIVEIRGVKYKLTKVG